MALPGPCRVVRRVAGSCGGLPGLAIRAPTSPCPISGPRTAVGGREDPRTRAPAPQPAARARSDQPTPLVRRPFGCRSNYSQPSTPPVSVESVEMPTCQHAKGARPPGARFAWEADTLPAELLPLGALSVIADRARSAAAARVSGTVSIHTPVRPKAAHQNGLAYGRGLASPLPAKSTPGNADARSLVVRFRIHRCAWHRASAGRRPSTRQRR